MSEHPYDVDTASRRVGLRSHEARLTDRWHTLNQTPNGGYLLATAMRALQADMPLPDPLVVSATYLKPGTVGPAMITTKLLRTGRRVATAEATMSQNGADVMHLMASFTDRANLSGRTHVVASPPDLPTPEECPHDLPVPGHMSIVDRIEYRLPTAPGWASRKPSGDPSAQFWLRLEGDHPVDLVALTLLVDGFAPSVFELGEFRSSTIQLTVHLHGVPAPGWLACRSSTRFVVGGMHEEDVEIWDSAGAIVAQSRQLAILG